MSRQPRSTLAAGLVLALVGLTPASAVQASAPTLHVEVLRVAPVGARAPAAATNNVTTSSSKACSDKAYSLTGARWYTTYQWQLRIGSAPSGLKRDAAEKAINRGVGNIVKANNDCGRADRVRARAAYLGRTTRKPSCRTRDGHNVIGFRDLPAGMAARACWWYSGDRIIEADVQINATIRWTTGLAGCRDQLMLEAVMTHEAGHVFGLGHVGEKKHGRLTMSTYIDGPCQNAESTLGLGDMLGLERLYP